MGVIIRTVSFSAAVTDSLNNVQRISLPSDFTVTPKLIRVVLTGATTDGTPTDDAQFSEGWYDGTSSWVTGLRANDVGVGINSDTDSYSTTSAATVGYIITQNAQTAQDYCQWDAWGTDGGVGYVDLEWNGGGSPPTAAILGSITAYAGDDLEAEVGVFTVTGAAGSQQTVTVASTLHPKVIRFAGSRAAITTGNNYATNFKWGSGWAVSDQAATPTITQFAHGFESQDNASRPWQGQVLHSSDEVGGTARCLAYGDDGGSGSGQVELEVDDTEDGLFRYRVRGTAETPDVGFVAMDFNGAIEATTVYYEQIGSSDLGYDSTPSITFGHELQQVDWTATDFASTGYGRGNLHGSFNPYSLASVTGEGDTNHAMVVRNRNTGSNDAFSYKNTSAFISTRIHDNSSTRYETTFTSWDATGFTMTIGTITFGTGTKVHAAIGFGVNALAREASDTEGLTDAADRALALARAAADTAGITDAVEKFLESAGVNYLKEAPDTEGLVDAALAAMALARAVGETLSSSDAALAALAMARAAGDSETLADFAGRLLALAREVTETEGLADFAGAALALAREAGDTEGLADAALAALGKARAASDTEGLTDAALRALAQARAAADTEGLVDAALRALVLSREAADTEALTDAALRALILARAVTEVEDISDAALAALALAREATADTEGLADAALAALGKAREGSETESLTDAALAALGKARAALADTEGLSDAADRALAMARSPLAETADLLEEAVAALALSRSAADTEDLSDFAGRLLELARAAPDTEAVVDAAVRAITFYRSAGDTAGLTDEARHVLTVSALLKAAADSLGLTDTAERLLALGGLAPDTEDLSDVALRAITAARSAPDTEGLSDFAGRAFVFAREASETESLSDAALSVLGLARAASPETAVLTDVALAVGGLARAAADTLGLTDAGLGLLVPITIDLGTQSLELEVGDNPLRMDVADSVSLRLEVGDNPLRGEVADPVSLPLEVGDHSFTLDFNG